MSTTIEALERVERALDLRRQDRLWYGVALGMVASGVAHGVVQLVLGGPWDGPVSWRKPTTFGLSFGITLATITWVTGLISMPSERRTRLLSVFAFACVLEVFVITAQAWRKVPSHFNTSTPLNAAFAYAAAAGGALIIVTSVAFAFATFRATGGTPSMRLALRVGFGSLLVTLAIGAAMIAIGTVAARTESQQAAYSAATKLKWGHAVTMHGILVLPGLAWLLARTDGPEERRVRVVAAVSGLYVLGAAAVVVATVLATLNWPPLTA